MIENRRHKVMCQTVVETKDSIWKLNKNAVKGLV